MKQLGISLLLCIGTIEARAQLGSEPPLVYTGVLMSTGNSTTKTKFVVSMACSQGFETVIEFAVNNEGFFIRTNQFNSYAKTNSFGHFQTACAVECTNKPSGAFLTAYLAGTQDAFTASGIQWGTPRTISWASHGFGSQGPEDMTGTLKLNIPITISDAGGGPNPSVYATANNIYTVFIAGGIPRIPDPLQ